MADPASIEAGADPPPAATTPPAITLGGPLIPAPLLAELIATGGLTHPSEVSFLCRPS